MKRLPCLALGATLLVASITAARADDALPTPAELKQKLKDSLAALDALGARTPYVAGQFVIMPFGSAAADYVTGLAGLNVIDSTTFKPERVADQRVTALAGLRTYYAPNDDDTYDLDYTVQSLTYVNHPEFDFLDNTLGGGVEHILGDRDTISLHADLSRSFAAGGLSGYSWQEHAGTAYVHDFTAAFSAAFGADYSHYDFDASDTLNSDMYSVSATPRYKLDGLPLDLSVSMVFGRNLAEVGYQSFGFVELSPSVLRRFANRDYAQASFRYGRYDFDDTDAFQTGATRRDDIYGFTAGYYHPVVTVPKLGDVVVYGRYTHTQDDSTLARQSYISDAVSIGVSIGL